MRELKDTPRAKVHAGFDGRVHKWFYGALARERYSNEVRILRHLGERGCEFVPKLLKARDKDLCIVTSNCGAHVDQISDDKLKQLFDELETYGVRHNDPFARNVTYDHWRGRFCIIDFEFATLLESGEGLTVEEVDRRAREERDERGD